MFNFYFLINRTIRFNLKFNLITANLPYIADSEESSLSSEVQKDPALALYGGKDGLDILLDFIKQAPLYLHPGGIVAL